MYALIFRTVFRRMDAERAHRLGYRVIRLLGLPVIRALVGRLTRPAVTLQTTAFGVTFPTPFGVAAGFDKEGHAVRGLGALGFGHVEIGTVTAVAQPGNPRPRLVRLVRDRALVNRMGFNNDGADAVAARLDLLRRRGPRPVIGVNIGKSRVVEVDRAVDDYLASARVLAPLADYLVVNVSSPNTPGLRGLQDEDRLEPLLGSVRDAAGDTPVLVKIAPDLDDEQLRGIAALVERLGVPGVVATNTTLSRTGLTASAEEIAAAGKGGLSGRPLRARSLEVLRLLRATLPDAVAIVSVGGVDTVADVAERLDAGATLVQGYTAFLYRGPLWAHRINRGLARRATATGTRPA